MKSKIIPVVLGLCVLACIVLIYCLVFETRARLFYLNMGVALVSAVLLLANIPLLSSRSLLTFKNAATSLVVNLYAVLLFLWTTVYSFFVETDADFRVLYIGLLALTVLFAVCLGTTELGGGVMQVEENRSNGSRQGCKQFRTSLENHWNELQGLCASAGGEAGDALLRSLRLTFDKLSSIPANKLEGHDAELQEVDRRLLEIKMLLAPDGPDKEAGGATQICQKADELQRYVTSMKSTL